MAHVLLCNKPAYLAHVPLNFKSWKNICKYGDVSTYIAQIRCSSITSIQYYYMLLFYLTLSSMNILQHCFIMNTYNCLFTFMFIFYKFFCLPVCNSSICYFFVNNLSFILVTFLEIFFSYVSEVVLSTKFFNLCLIYLKHWTCISVFWKIPSQCLYLFCLFSFLFRNFSYIRPSHFVFHIYLFPFYFSIF